MKKIADCETSKCIFEILKISNGYILQIKGTSDENKNYNHCIYYSEATEVFIQFKFFVELLGGTILYNMCDIEW